MYQIVYLCLYQLYNCSDNMCFILKDVPINNAVRHSVVSLQRLSDSLSYFRLHLQLLLGISQERQWTLNLWTFYSTQSWVIQDGIPMVSCIPVNVYSFNLYKERVGDNNGKVSKTIRHLLLCSFFSVFGFLLSSPEILTALKP